MAPNVKELLRKVETWPEEDQEELAEVARDIEARRNGEYRPTTEELEAIDGARGEVVSKEEIEAAFARFRRG
jgi:hypothetical protein